MSFKKKCLPPKVQAAVTLVMFGDSRNLTCYNTSKIQHVRGMKRNENGSGHETKSKESLGG